MFKILVLIISFITINAFAATEVHSGMLEASTFLGYQSSQRDSNSTFSGGLQIGADLIELGTMEFTAETALSSYPDNHQRFRSFDIALKKTLFSGEMVYPYIIGGFGLLTYYKSETNSDSSVTFAKMTVDFGAGFKVRLKKDFYARMDQKYFLFKKDNNLTYRSLTSLGVLYTF